jgi:hypothetical protein
LSWLSMDTIASHILLIYQQLNMFTRDRKF